MLNPAMILTSWGVFSIRLRTGFRLDGFFLRPLLFALAILDVFENIVADQ